MKFSSRRGSDNWADDVDFRFVDEELAQSPAAPPGRPIPTRWAALVAIGTALALAVSFAGWQYRSRDLVTVRHVQPPGPGALDASGCPIGANCFSTPDAQLSLAGEVASRFPGESTVVSARTTSSIDNDVTYLTSETVRLRDRTLLTVTAQCVPRGRTIPAPPVPLIPVDVRGPIDFSLVQPGEPGCSVAVQAHVPRGATVNYDALLELATDPAIPLRP